MTLRPCCAEKVTTSPRRPSVKCDGCDNRQQLVAWCGYCGKEQPQCYPGYGAAAKVKAYRDERRLKFERAQKRREARERRANRSKLAPLRAG